MRVCFVAGTLGRGGAERQLVYMLRALVAQGARARVLCLTRGEAFEAEIESLGVPVECVAAPGARLARARKLRRIIQALRRAPADVLQSSHFYTNLYVAAAARVLRTREIGAIRNNLSSEVQANGALGWGHLYAPRHLIANSKAGRARALKYGIRPNRIDLVHNVVPVCGDGELAGRGVGRELRILFVGRLTEQKRPDRFLRVTANVIRKLRRQNVTATIVGDGPLRPGLAALAAELGLRDAQCQLVGERQDLGAVYQSADLLVLTSDWEGTPNVLLEAMAHRLPVAATRVGGVPEIVGADCGLLVDPSDEDALTDAILRLSEDAPLRARLGARGQEYVARFHSLDALGAQLTGIYEKLLAR